MGPSSTSFVLEAGSCATGQYWGKRVVTNPSMVSLTLGLATPALETTA